MTIKKTIVATALLLAVNGLFNSATAQQKGNTLSAAEKAAGWQLLFDGTSTTGWHTYNKPELGSAWEAKDGILHLKKHDDGAGGGDAVTAEAYGDFDLKLQWKISPKGNSGILFLVQEEPKYEYSYFTGPEMQVLDNNGHSDAKIIKHRAGDLYDLITSKPETVKPTGEWNSIEIKLHKSKLEFWQNGVKVVSTTMWDDNWKKLVAGSKFKSMEGFGASPTGHIALQDHGNEVWYKDIKIKKL